LQHDYDFNWEEVDILDTKLNYNKRLMSEITYTYISKDKRTIYHQMDTEFLDEIYVPLLNNYNKLYNVLTKYSLYIL